MAIGNSSLLFILLAYLALGNAFLSGSFRRFVPDGQSTADSRLGASSKGENQGLEVVLFGIGDLRTDDHQGLQVAIQSGNPVFPLFVLDDETIRNIPGAITHTTNTANILSACLSDLDDSLKSLDLQLHVKIGDKSLETALQTLFADLPVAQNIRVHVCDLMDVDNKLGYGPFAQLECMPGAQIVLEGTKDFLEKDYAAKIETALPVDGFKDTPQVRGQVSSYTTTFDGEDHVNFEVIPWRQNLRENPWQRVADLPVAYLDYETTYVLGNAPIVPVETKKATNTQLMAIPNLKVPSKDNIMESIIRALNLDPKRCEAETNTGLYATHWGGLESSTAGPTNALQILQTYIHDCQEDDSAWIRHPEYLGRRCKRNERSLEHSAMIWQLKGDGSSPFGKADVNWLAGESITRFLSASLLFGTVSMRRIWHLVQKEKPWFPSPLKRLVEAREWHMLLGARNIRTNSAFQGRGITRFDYWRYHGYLCRYMVKGMDESSNEGLLLIHGFGASGTQWDRMLECIKEGETDIQGLAPDLIGFGESEKPFISYTGYLWDSMVMDFSKEIALGRHNWSSFVIGGNSIGGFTSMSTAANDMAEVEGRAVSSSGAPGTGRCTGLVLMNSAGPVKTKDEIVAERRNFINEIQFESVAQVTTLDALPPCKPPARPVARILGNALLAYLRPRIQSICKNLYPTNPAAVDDTLCKSILRDSLDPGGIAVMMAGSKLPPPRTANELLKADFGAALKREEGVVESVFDGPVLIAQGVLDPLNDAKDRMNRFGALRKGVTVSPIQAGHCPHDELPKDVATSILTWITTTQVERKARLTTKQHTFVK